ncbi:MAG: S8 family serine peptidase [Xanthomonadales bacterium]|nr:S8 family serine peptidase [Xanthomonadales bacterium]
MSSSPDRRNPLVLAASLTALLAGGQSLAGSLDPALRDFPGMRAALVQLESASPPVRHAGESPARWRERLVGHWRAHAAASQERLAGELDRLGIDHRGYWLVNAVRVEATAAQLAALADRAGVHAVLDDAPRALPVPVEEPVIRAPAAIEWGVDRIGAPVLWALGIRGQGVTVGGQDTGVRWDHAALRDSYRGWNGATASHDHHWHDAIRAIIGTGTNPCGLNAQSPCDDNNHGTHTIGTITGDDGGSNQIGVAPDAHWVACRNMERGNGTPSTYIECFQWFVAPTDLAGGNPRPDLAPDVINNSWGCPPSEGCTTPAILEQAVVNVRTAGIVVVVSAGNSGSSCGTIVDPPAIYDASFTVGSTTSANAMSGFSSRGPVAAGIGSRPKPDVVAPGSSVRSATRTSTTSYGTFSGTSMAGPHVAGAVALLISGDERLRGRVARIEKLLRRSAVPVGHAQVCAGIPAASVPNPVSGWGRIDVAAAWQLTSDTLFFDEFE